MNFLKISVEIIFSPLGLTVILIGSGIILGYVRRHARTGRALLICGSLLFLLLLFSPVSEYLVLGLEKGYPPLLNPPGGSGSDRIVVLAGYAEENSGFPVTTNLSKITISSLSEGLRLYRLAPGAKLIVSGGVARKGEKPVAAFMAEFLREMGVPTNDIVIEGNSHNTYENLVEVKKILGSSPFILVAQACDLRRAIAVCRKLNMKSIPAPAGNWVLQYHTNDSVSGEIARFAESFIYPSTENLVRVQWAYHEYVGLVWYRLLGRI